MFEGLGSAWPLVTGSILAVIGGVFAILNRRGGERAARRRQLPPTWPEMWARMDALEENDKARDRKLTALVSVLTDVAEQWPEGATPPKFSAADLEELGDTMPASWRPKRATGREATT